MLPVPFEVFEVIVGYVSFIDLPSFLDVSSDFKVISPFKALQITSHRKPSERPNTPNSETKSNLGILISSAAVSSCSHNRHNYGLPMTPFMLFSVPIALMHSPRIASADFKCGDLAVFLMYHCSPVRKLCSFCLRLPRYKFLFLERGLERYKLKEEEVISFPTISYWSSDEREHISCGGN